MHAPFLSLGLLGATLVIQMLVQPAIEQLLQIPAGDADIELSMFKASQLPRINDRPCWRCTSLPAPT